MQTALFDVWIKHVMVTTEAVIKAEPFTLPVLTLCREVNIGRSNSSTDGHGDKKQLRELRRFSFTEIGIVTK